MGKIHGSELLVQIFFFFLLHNFGCVSFMKEGGKEKKPRLKEGTKVTKGR